LREVIVPGRDWICWTTLGRVEIVPAERERGARSDARTRLRMRRKLTQVLNATRNLAIYQGLNCLARRARVQDRPHEAAIKAVQGLGCLLEAIVKICYGLKSFADAKKRTPSEDVSLS